MILHDDFYLRDDVLLIAQELLGKELYSMVDGHLTGGIIVETEAYKGPEDRACHAFNNRRTPRTEVMFHAGGIAYVYLCYGMHDMLNIVTGPANTPHAILIRAIAPTHGVEVMQERRGKSKALTSGPGSVCQALGITRELNGHSLQGPILRIEDMGYKVPEIRAMPRIGIDYAGADALLPWRFLLEFHSQNE
jgi:DNA-3-methyladenine glycosylase